MQHVFKTIYFPRDRVRAQQAARVTVSLPAEDSRTDQPGFARYVASLSSAELRQVIGNPLLEDLEALAEREARSLSNVVVQLLRRTFESGQQTLEGMSLPTLRASAPGDAARGVTFQESKRLPIHGWYPYVEGFSAPYVREIFQRFGTPESVYDPFGGAGTTQLTASIAGVPSWFSEVNPFMVFVADTKVEASRHACADQRATGALLEEYVERIGTELGQWAAKVDLSGYYRAFPKRDFFEEQHLRELLGALALAEDVASENPAIHALLRLACAANAVHCSNMTRRADLRRRRPDEYKTRVVNVRSMVSGSVLRMAADIRHHPVDAAPTTFVSTDCRDVPATHEDQFALAITSPPYLNGTNYFRNTKIELWLLDFIASEHELGNFRAQAVAAGINNVTKTRTEYHEVPDVEEVASRLDEQAGDMRIPLLVRHYFSDMSEVMASVYRVLAPGGRFVFDIGDSKFYGVHVPTDRFIESIAHETGFELESSAVLARRYSRDKSELVQRELVFRKAATA